MLMHCTNMAAMEQFAAFDPATTEGWESYSMPFRFYFQVNGVTDPQMKRAVFFSLCGRETFNVTWTILAPEQIVETAFDTITGHLKDHFSLQSSKITFCHTFYTRSRAASESVTELLPPSGKRHTTATLESSRTCFVTSWSMVCVMRKFKGSSSTRSSWPSGRHWRKPPP